MLGFDLPSTIATCVLVFGRVTQAQYWPVVAENTPTSYDFVTSTSTLNPIQTNIGPLPPFKEPASCSLLTGAFFIEVATELYGSDFSTGYDTTTYSQYTGSQVLRGGIGGEYSNFPPEPTNTDSDFISTYKEPTYTLSPVPCMPTNFYDGSDNNGFLAQRYYSPAPSCPNGRKAVNSTTFTSTSTFNGKAALVTETAALCCPEGYIGAESGGQCVLSGTGVEGFQAWTVIAYYSFDNPTSLIRMSTTLDAQSVLEQAIQIRWQTTDVTPGATLPTYVPKTVSNTASGTGSAAGSASTSKKSIATRQPAPLLCFVVAALAFALIL